MIANRRRGEVAAEFDGKAYRLCLTLGALAELEAVYAADDLGAGRALFARETFCTRHHPGDRRWLARRRQCDFGRRGGRHAGGKRRCRVRGDGRGTACRDVRRRRAGGDLAKPLKAAAGAAQPFPWNDVMATGLGLLRLSPENFWSMTPREFERAASVLPKRADTLRKDELAELMRQFPDE